MSESIPSPYKTFSWLLVILVIGVVALYSWNNESQNEAIAEKDSRIAEAARVQAETERRLDQSEETSEGLRAQNQELTNRLEVAHQANQTLRTDMEAVKAGYAETLAAEQEKAGQAYAELQATHEAANERIAALDAEIEQLEQTLANATGAHEERMSAATAAHEARLAEVAAGHETRAEELEQELNEKIDFYRTALEGRDPERAAQLTGLKQQVEDSGKTIEESRQAMQALRENKAGLEEQLASANLIVAEREQALSRTGQELGNVRARLTQEQSALTALRQEHDAAVAEATETLARLHQEALAAAAAHEKAMIDAAAAMESAQESHTARIAEAEGRISELTGRVQAETAALEALQEEHKTTVSALRGSLEATEQSLAGVEAELSTIKEAAVQARRTHEQSRKNAAQDLAASRQEGKDAMVNVRGMYREFSKLRGQHTDRGMLLSLAEDDLRFRIGNANLPDGELQSLDRIAELLTKHPDLKARIEGHTDYKGRGETNLELSRKRAEAVRHALIERGIDPGRMTADGLGEASPIADNGSSAGRRKNRRVEIYVVEN